ncbi:MAG: rhamnulokinase [Bacteroidales bacterium]|jgi:rhamnulokinase|nr:rhamnulokinase [Bacteroidales bacterium]
MKNYVCAIDFGATSGRMIISRINENGLLETEEVRRFPNAIQEKDKDGKFYWNMTALIGEVVAGLKDLANRKDIKIEGIGVDTWGVDVVFIDKQGNMIEQPRAYRDPYSVAAMDEYVKKVGKEKIYQKTGIQFMNFNTLFQLYACHKENFQPFEQADKYLFIPDYVSYYLSGKAVCEYTICSTSEFLNPKTKQIDAELIEAAGAKMEKFPPITMPGQIIGNLKKDVVDFGYDVPVIAIAGHDTGSAVAAVPAKDEKFAYLSSGTWSLMGIESKDAIINERSYQLNFTNEGGVEGTTRFLKNITGMWILEQCRKEWKAAGKDYDFVQLAKMEQSAPAFRSFINPDDASFANPPSMLQAINDYCAKTGQPQPEDDSQVARLIMESLALRYRTVFGWLKELADFPLEVLHIIGGGAKNALLAQWTSNSIGVPVLTGPTEATAIGNIMMQFKALGKVKDINEMRALIAKATPLDRYEPQDTQAWSEAYKRYVTLCEK